MNLDFTHLQWGWLGLAALLLGLSRTGIPGIGGLFVVIFASLLPGRVATGVALPLLLVADLFGVVFYHRYASWRHLRQILPWTVAGVVLGWLALDQLDDAQTTRLIGGLILMLLALQYWLGPRALPAREVAGREAPRLSGLLGILAGFSTLVANAAGPIVNLYLLAQRVPKAIFLGTGAIFFLVINWFKVPFLAQLGLINRSSLLVDLRLAPWVVLGALLGPALVRRVEQRMFDQLTAWLIGAAALKLLLS